MPGVTAEIHLAISASLAGTADLGTPQMRVTPISELIQLSAGTAAVNQCDLMFSDTRTVALSSSENLDLAGVLTDAFGATITAAEIVAIFIKAAAANVNSVVVGAAATTPFLGPLGATGTYTIKPGEYFLAVSQTGWAVTAATADLLKIANSGAGTGVTFDVLILGRSVAA